MRCRASRDGGPAQLSLMESQEQGSPFRNAIRVFSFINKIQCMYISVDRHGLRLPDMPSWSTGADACFPPLAKSLPQCPRTLVSAPRIPLGNSGKRAHPRHRGVVLDAGHSTSDMICIDTHSDQSPSSTFDLILHTSAPTLPDSTRIVISRLHYPYPSTPPLQVRTMIGAHPRLFPPPWGPHD